MSNNLWHYKLSLGLLQSVLDYKVPHLIRHHSDRLLKSSSMKKILQFHPKANKLAGPAGTLPIERDDELARRFLMLVEGECLAANVAAIAQKYGYCRQRYYQILDAFEHGGLPALQTQKTGPKSNYRRTDQAVRQVLRYRFLDPESSPDVIAQKLRQTHFPISLRSVQRVIADYGLQKKTLRTQPQKAASPSAHSKRRPATAPPKSRPRQPGTSGPTTPGG
jgi:hypothetical protein